MKAAQGRHSRRLSWMVLAAVLIIAVPIGLYFSYRNGGTENIFAEVTFSSGLRYQGMTYGASWGDLDRDGLPDLYLGNHGNPGTLYRNQGNGQFSDITENWLDPDWLSGDEHGAAWADFDNDGDQDLLVLRGGGRGVGTGPNHLYVNNGSQFEERADTLGIANPYARARMPLWYDFNRDGWLDLFLGGLERKDGQAPAAVFTQENGRFTEDRTAVPFATASVPFCIITELTDDAAPELVCRVQGSGKLAGQVFNTATFPSTELDLLYPTHFDDIAAGDFDGDLRQDLYLARQPGNSAVLASLTGINEAVADIEIGRQNVGNTHAFSFRSEGELGFRIWPEYPHGSLTGGQLHIGSQGTHPAHLAFTLSPETGGIEGNATPSPGSQIGYFIGFTPPDRWRVAFTSEKDFINSQPEKKHQVAVRIISSDEIKDLQIEGNSNEAPIAPDRLLIHHGDKMDKEGDARGVNDTLSASVNVVAADFDNDMDLDLYIVASGAVANQHNRLLINDGQGNFKEAPHAGGARGSRSGVGDAVAIADYDLDGFLDLLIANGGSMGRSYGLPAETGGYQLYRNLGNSNHWLEIDLEGTQSNRDAIGAKVVLRAGGVTQMRIQDGGIHERGQNFQRLHFGLDKHSRIDNITVYWPSGTVQELSDLPADQIIRIKETST